VCIFASVSPEHLESLCLYEELTVTADVYFDGQPLHLDPGPQLLLDDHLVEDRWALERVLHKPEKFPRNPVLVRDKPWEGDVAYRPCVIADGGRYRMWYQCFSFTNYHGAGGPPYYLGYAESDDGYQWHKPKLDVCPGYEGSNIIYTGTHYARLQGVQVWRDDVDTAPRRYKMICVERSPSVDGVLASGVHMCISADGLQWSLDGAPLLDYHSDCHNHVVRDAARDRWLLYCRPIVMSAVGRRYPRFQEGGRHTRRRVSVATSPDLRTWSYPRTTLLPDEVEPNDIDSCSVFRWNSHFLMLYASMEGDETGTNEGRLASSADGLRWHRFHSGDSFLPRGATGQWDGGQVIPADGPLRQGDQMLFYYSGFSQPQYDPSRMGGVGLATLRADQFVEQRGGDRPGYLLTREFVCEGSQLQLNTIMRGMPYHEQAIRVEIARRPEVLGHAGHVQAVSGFALEDCDPLRGTRTDVPVSWQGNGDLSSLLGQSIYLRFEIRNMGLFAFEVIS
jgi:hypothetical protein